TPATKLSEKIQPLKCLPNGKPFAFQACGRDVEAKPSTSKVRFNHSSRPAGSPGHGEGRDSALTAGRNAMGAGQLLRRIAGGRKKFRFA
ncbi:hypothetical protein, partial [Rhodosalinus sp. K401]|uniref:hypothetical protein n=1 Tax=Rhodosalinus sp. K401 TaxID=3239195 RepID=UPI0035260703